MKYALPVRFLTRAYLDFESLILSPADVQGVLTAIGRNDLLPMQVLVASSPGAHSLRQLLVTSRGDWQLLLSGKSVDVTHVPTDPSGANMVSIYEFTEQSVHILRSVVSALGRKSYRLALVTEGLLEEMSVEHMEAIGAQLLRPTPFYRENRPFEWTWHWGSQAERELRGVRELINCLTTVKRQTGNLASADGMVELDRVQINLDLSTSHLATAERIEPDGFADYFQCLMEYYERLSHEISAITSKPD